MQQRDMTEQQYRKALDRHGFKPAMLGYVYVNDKVQVFPGNAGPRRRDRLAYLIKEREHWSKK